MSSNNGKEVTVEDNPESKFLVEKDTDLPKSCLWPILERYYETVSIDAWRKNQVPSFITSNSRLANGYARLIHNFIMDQNQIGSSFNKIYIVEVGGGHGRFTYLLLKALEKYSPTWEDLGYPDVPFKYIFTDASNANFSFLMRDSSVLIPYIKRGWLDLACFNGNHSEPSDIRFGTNTQETIPPNSNIVLVCNYVLDSLLTDAIAISKDKVVSRATVSVYSSQIEEDLTHPSIADRMTLLWSWREISSEDYTADSNCTENQIYNSAFEEEKVDEIGSNLSFKEQLLLKYSQNDFSLYNVIKSYIDLEREMSFVLPLGAISMLRRFFEYSKGNICVLIGDKGYPDDSEFLSIKPPHIAVHGCMSFMVNLDAIKKYFCNLGGSSLATKYKDTFQITCILGKKKSCFPRIVGSFIDSEEDLVPDNLLSIQRGFEQFNLTVNPCVHGLKPYLGVLRYSLHDPFILWVLRDGILSNIGDLNVRQREDVISDLREVYQNIYPLELNIDVFDLLAQICLKGGFVNEAIFYYNESLRCCSEMKHPSTFVNLAKCYQSQRNWKKAFYYCNEALKMDPSYAPALEFNSEYLNSSRRLNYIIVGCYSSWMFTDIIPTIQFDAMYNCIGVVPTSSTIENAKKAFDNLQAIFSCNQENEIFSTSPPKFFLEQLTDSSIVDTLSEVFESHPQIEAVILDVPPDLLRQCIIAIWEFDKHVMTRSPASRDANSASELLSIKPPRSLWFDYSPFKFETALLQVFNIIKQHGRLYAINCKYDLPSETPITSENYKHDEIMARLIYSLSAIHIAIDGTLDWVFCPSPDSDNKKTLFCGWSSPLWPQSDSGNRNISPNNSSSKPQLSTKSDEIHCTISTEFVTWDRTYVQFDFHCDNCTLTLRKEGPIWILLIRTSKGKYESKIQCVGLQTANERFRKLCKDYNPELYSTKDFIGFSAWWDAIVKSKESPVHLTYHK
ncbi:tetratricopeptide repeat-containing protein [Cryptosporidium felis]|nr:tetratricopeptide repeat-containing protein [Cryptosporidium felis]